MSRMYTPDAMGWTFEEPFRCVLYVHLSHLLMSNPRFGLIGYCVHTFALDSASWLPQHRDRWYLVAVHESLKPSDMAQFVPVPPGEALPLQSMPTTNLQWQSVADVSESHLGTVFQRNLRLVGEKCATADVCSTDWVCADMGSSESHKSVAVNYAPCVTKARSSAKRFWVFTGDFMFCTQLQTLHYAFLQGWLPDHISKVGEYTSDTEIRGSIGNGMSVPVMASIMTKVLMVVGLSA